MPKNPQPRAKTVRKLLAEGTEEVRRITSPEFKRVKREEVTAREKANFIERGTGAGFSKQMAEFLYEHLAGRRHEHWDGRLD